MLDGAVRSSRTSRRWHESPVDPAQRRLAWMLALLLHGLFVFLAWYAMRPAAPPPAATEEIMQVRLFSDTVAAYAPPPPLALPPPPPAAPPPLRHREPPAKDALVVQTPPVPPPRLFDANGQPLLPAPTTSAAPVPGYVQRMPQGDTQLMQHDSPVKYRATPFAKDWSGGGNSVDNALQKLVDKTTVKKTIRLPGGIRIHCAVSLAMLAGGCGGDLPPPPSAKDGDERLNMAPARSLDSQPPASTPPSVESCIAMYRAGKPLAHGCPVDTPNRAVDAELRERAGHSRQRGQ